MPDRSVTADEVRRAVATQFCPWCDEGPWRSLAHHTSQAHGVTADQLREIAGWTDRHRVRGLCSPTTSERYAETSAEQSEHGRERAEQARAERRARVLEHYKSGASVRELAAAEGLSVKLMKQYLERSGIERESLPDFRTSEHTTESQEAARRRNLELAREARARPPGAVCTVDGCDRLQDHREWCSKHYQRWRKHGDPTKVGQPNRHIVPVPERFWSKVDQSDDDGCWIWTGATNATGYGQFWMEQAQHPAHRVAYTLTHGPIADDLTLDHLCRNRQCVRPDHLEPCTRGENTMRGETITAANAAKTHCPRGHPYDSVNTYVCRKGKRSCRQCSRDRQRRNARKG